MDYSPQYVEQYGHGKPESNSLPDTDKVTIQDNDGHYDVYTCSDDSTAADIASWYISAVYASYPEEVELVKHNARFFSVEIVE